MRYSEIVILVLLASSVAAQAHSLPNRCADLKITTLTGVEITDSEAVAVGKTIAPAYPGASAVGLPPRALPH